MKYVIRLLPVLLALFTLSACDTPADVRVGGTPVNGGSGSLDPDDDFNIVAYFYTDRPVSNLRYICTRSGTLPIVGKTNNNGSFVCPRDRRVSFYVGEPAGLKLGDVDLKIYGNRAPVADDGSDDGEADARENVTITPSTLYGSAADYSKNEVANIFQLLRLIDTSTGAEPQDRIIISDEMHAMFNSFATTVSLSVTPDDFFAYIGPIVAAANSASITLRSGGVALSPPDPNLKTLVNRSLVAARAGLYRYVPPIQGFERSGAAVTRAFNASMGLLVGRNGQASGMGYSWVKTLGVGDVFETMTLTPGGGVLANGTLNNLTFTSAINDPLMVTGRFVNDLLLAASTLLDPTDTTNYKIPYTYTFNGSDVGKFTQGAISDNLTVYRQFESLPDIDLDALGGALVLPREFGVLYQDYPDGSLVTDAQRANTTSYGGANKTLRFRILPNGDIVSVTTGRECETVSDDNGQYRHPDSTPESLIGQVGGIFQDSGKRYITFMLAVYDPAHPDFGFQLGTPALDGAALDPVVISLDSAPIQLLNKFCDPDLTDCDRYVEWFNSDVFYAQVAAPLIASNGTIPDVESGQAYLRKPGYMGRISGFTAFSCP